MVDLDMGTPDFDDFEDVDGPQHNSGTERIIPVSCGCVVIFYGPANMVDEAITWHESYCTRPKPRPC